MATQPRSYVSLDQFFAESDRFGGKRNFYYDGQLYRMDSATPDHSLIGANIAGALREAFRLAQQYTCLIFDASVEIYIPRTTAGTEGIFMPDVSVVCEPTHLLPPQNRAIINPVAIFEVLSPSTEHKDQTEKFAG